jgi:hypothetical protein
MRKRGEEGVVRSGWLVRADWMVVLVAAQGRGLVEKIRVLIAMNKDEMLNACGMNR